MVIPGGSSVGPSKLISLIIFDSFWMYGALGDILTSLVSNSHFGKRREARDTRFSFPFLRPSAPGPSLPLLFLLTFWGLQALGGIHFFQLSNFIWDAVKIMPGLSLGPEI